MALTYTQLVALVRTWCNRDEEVVSDAIIQDALKYAADKAYRTLRVPPLENVAIYEKTLLQAGTKSANSLQGSITEIQLPYDLIEFIQIREVDSAGLTTRVFNEKLDIRTFNDALSEKYTNLNYWARQQNVVYLTPGFGAGSTGNQANTIELYYYRRLPALNAVYAVTVLNYNAGFLTTSGAGSGVANSKQLFFNSNTGTIAYADATTAQAASAGGTVTNAYYIGTSTPNWLRDENQRILLFGALAEVFAYVQDDQQASKYNGAFLAEIAEANDEDAKRNASGGNLQVNFNGRGLI
tara:strand:- start:3479 stop:4366 length:888 start_codon:yes stop_codon:yes gene_type:complete